MSEMVATRYAVRVMGVWVRRADALLQEGALTNAAGAVREQQEIVAAQRAALSALTLPLRERRRLRVAF